MSAPIMELRGISKIYPGVAALSAVSFDIRPGEVLGLIGENGAGKSTLMKIMGGIVAPTAGVIRVDGAEHAALSVGEATRAGVAFVHQELNLFDNLTVGANVLIGREPTRGGPLRLVDRAAVSRRVAPILARLGASFGPETPLADLSLAERQLVEIAKALSLDARILILDEPTSSLTVAETARLLDRIAELKRAGVSVVFISHRLNEIAASADRVVGLRDGRVVGELSGAAIEHDAMIRLMIGRDLRSLYIPPARPPGTPALRIEGLVTRAHPRRAVSLDLRQGEILGFAGLVGSGRTEIARAVFGIDRPVAGEVRVGDAVLEPGSPRAAIEAGVFLIPEDRKRSGLLLDVSIAENITLADLDRYARFGLIATDREDEAAERLRRRLNIRTPDTKVQAGSLSGGNQQKVVLAKWLARTPKVLIFDEPTRGIDVGAKSEIYAEMRALADQGVAILMISSDMEEVIGVSDRMAVLCEGRIAGFLERPDFSEENVMRLAVGRSLH
jgi:ribose transport system ATP-binding protein